MAVLLDACGVCWKVSHHAIADDAPGAVEAMQACDILGEPVFANGSKIGNRLSHDGGENRAVIVQLEMKHKPEVEGKQT